MHTYYSLKNLNTIGIIAKKLPLEDLDKFCQINCTWYIEIQNELRRRWKLQVKEYYKKTLESDHYEVAKKQVEIEKCLLRNGMIRDSLKKEIVKYNISMIELGSPWLCDLPSYDYLWDEEDE